MPQVSLQSPGIVALVGKREAACVPQHVRVSLEAQTRLNACTLNHPGEASGAEGGTTLRCEHEGRLGFLLALKARGTPSTLDPANMQRSRSEVDLIPAKVNKLGGPKAVTIGFIVYGQKPRPTLVA